jgi:DNA-binding transcriptional MerR regulator
MKNKFDEWLTPNNLAVIAAWAREGNTDEEIAFKMGVHVKTLHSWKRRYPEISHSLKEGKENADARVEESLYKLALGFEYEEIQEIIEDFPSGNKRSGTKRKRIKFKKYSPPNATAIIFWLKNRKPAEWRDKIRQEIEITEKPEIIVEIENKNDE